MHYYFVAGAHVDSDRSVADNPQCAPLLPNGPWSGIAAVVNGKRGIILFPLGKMPPAEELSWEEDENDILVAVDKQGPPKMSELLRSQLPHSNPVTLSSGQVLHVGMAAFAPRKLMFGKKAGLGNASSRFAELSDKIYRKWQGDGVSWEDPELLEFFYEAIRLTYKITPGLLNIISPVETNDIGPLLEGIWNLRPKEEAPGVPT